MKLKDWLKGTIYTGLFAIPFLVLLVTESMFFPFITGKNFAFRIIVEIVFAAWLVLALIDAQYRPRISLVFAAFFGFIGVMFVANLLGEYPFKSFWSNFERMDGYVTLVHVFMYFLVLGSTLITEKLWNQYFVTTLIASTMLLFAALAQLSGSATTGGSDWRIEATLGNSTYMAVYLLFHIFIAGLLFFRTKTLWIQQSAVFLAVVFMLLVFQTGTRGTVLGLLGGVTLTALYFAFFGGAYPKIRKIAVWALISLAVLIAVFIAVRDTSFVQNDPRLARVANITLEQGETRFTIWSMAIDGIKERPLLGWGQENFSYVFNAQYRPSLYSQEAWFDRVHNIVFDWLIAGGILGFLAYVSIFAAALFALVVQPFFRSRGSSDRQNADEPFTVAERGLLLGILAGYAFHNVFVFDNLISYIFFAVILAFIHSRTARPLARIQAISVSEHSVAHIALPIVACALVFVLYTVNVPGILAAKDILSALRSNDPAVQLQEFEEALSRNSFADQEIREQMEQQVLQALRTHGSNDPAVQAFLVRTEEELRKFIAEKPNDARAHFFLATFYRAVGRSDDALVHLEKARELSPKKQTIIFEQGLVHMQESNYDIALEYFKEAYELAPEFPTAREFYALAALLEGDEALVNDLLDTDELRHSFAANNVVIQALYKEEEFALLTEYLELRIAAQPTEIAARTSLAAVYQEQGNIAAAIRTIEDAISVIPAFKEQGEEIIEGLRQLQ